MIDTFVRDRRTGRIVGSFAGVEGVLLRSLASQVIELLRHDQRITAQSRDPLEALLDFSGPEDAPSDPVLQRLLPNAYPDDDPAAADFRRFTETNLRDQKVVAAECVLTSLDAAGLPEAVTNPDEVFDVELTEPEADQWLRALNDIRLSLGTRLGIGVAPPVADLGVGDSDFDDDSPGMDLDQVLGLRHLYDWTSYLQGVLLEAIGEDLR